MERMLFVYLPHFMYIASSAVVSQLVVTPVLYYGCVEEIRLYSILKLTIWIIKYRCSWSGL